MKRNILLLTFSLLLFSCHKENNKPAANGYSGWLQVQKLVQNFAGGMPDSMEIVYACFYAAPFNPYTINMDSLFEAGGIYAGPVALNGLNMIADSSEDSLQYAYSLYTEDGPLHLDNSLTFQVGGAAGVPSFTYNAPGDIFKYHPIFPDTLLASGGYTLNLGAAGLGADSIAVTISGNSMTPVQKTFASGVDAVTFTPAELTSLGGGWGLIGISLQKQQDYTTDGKKYSFTGYYNISWAVTLQ